MRKLFLVLTIALSSCNNQNIVTYKLQDPDPFVQHTQGKIKSITRRHYQIEYGCHPDSVANMNKNRQYNTRVTTYDSTGRMLTLVDTLQELDYGIIARTMIYKNKNLIGWSGTGITMKPSYKGTISVQGDTLYKSIAATDEFDSSIIEIYNQIASNNKIEYQRSFNNVEGSIFYENKIYTYNSDGKLSQCTYENGLFENTTSEFSIVSRDKKGNVTQMNEYWPKDEKCRVITYFYEYYELFKLP